jgi:hypothetical protein
MVVNFRARRISRGARKLARTPTLKKKKEKKTSVFHADNKETNPHKISH